MDFVGTGKKLVGQDLIDAATALGTDVAVVRAVLEVEAAGAGFDDKKRPKILFEPHVFYKQLGPGAKRTEAVSKGLAYQKWGSKPYPKKSDDRYKQLAGASAIDEKAALNSASWGLPQIMGFNAGTAGFASAKAMASSMMKGEREQLLAFVSYLKGSKIAKHLVKKDWKAFALAYNGSGALTHGYDKKLKAAYDKFSKAAATVLMKPKTNKTFLFAQKFKLNQNA